MVLDSGQKRVLITGGSGYLGQHLLHGWEDVELGYTYNTSPLPAGAKPTAAEAFQMNLVDADSVALAISTFKPNVIIHTAAQSSPAASSKDPEGSMSINAPRALLDAIEKVPASKRPLLIYISTDQVFNGSIEGGGQPYPSDTPPKPVNAYGSSKSAFESMLQESKLPFVVLRSSNMVGEPAPFSGASKFLQWLEVKLSVKESEDDSAVDLFEDEVRSFVHVDDVVKAIRTLVAIWQSPENSTSTSAGVVVCNNDSSGSSSVGVGRKDAQLASDLWGLWRSGSGGVYNMGGPQGLSRVGLARALATARPTECSLLLKDGHSPKVRPSSRAALNDKLGYASPLDITMDSSSLEAAVAFKFRPMAEALARRKAGSGDGGEKLVATTAAAPEAVAPQRLPAAGGGGALNEDRGADGGRLSGASPSLLPSRVSIACAVALGVLAIAFFRFTGSAKKRQGRLFSA